MNNLAQIISKKEEAINTTNNRAIEYIKEQSPINEEFLTIANYKRKKQLENLKWFKQFSNVVTFIDENRCRIGSFTIYPKSMKVREDGSKKIIKKNKKTMESLIKKLSNHI